MNGNASELFPEMTPAPGGLQALKRRLDQEPTCHRRRVRRRVIAASFASAMAVGVLVLLTAIPQMRTAGGWPGIPSEGPAAGAIALRIDADLNPALIRLGVAEPALEPVTVPRDHRSSMAVERVNVNSSKVIFYRVSAVPLS